MGVVLIKWTCPINFLVRALRDSIIVLECNLPFKFSAYAPDHDTGHAYTFYIYPPCTLIENNNELIKTQLRLEIVVLHIVAQSVSPVQLSSEHTVMRNLL